MAFWSLFRREMVRFIRQPARIVATLATPLLFWFFIGGGVGSAFSVKAPSGESYSVYLLPGMIALSVMFSAIFSAMSLIDDRNSGFLQSALVSPAPRATIVLAKVLSCALIAFAQGAAILAVALAFAASPVARIGVALCALFAMAFALSALGFALAWFSQTTQTFHALMNGLLMPMWAMSGALFGAQGAAAPLAWMVRVNPLSPFVALLRAGLSGGETPSFAVTLCVLACLGLAFASVRRTALAAAAFVLFVACGGAPSGGGRPQAELSFRNMRLTELEHGKTRFFARAASAQGSMQGGLEVEDVHVEHRGVASSDPQVQLGALTIDAAHGEIGISNGAVEAIAFSGGVQVRDSHERTFSSEKLVCSFAEQHVSAPGPVTLDSPGIHVTAQGIEGSLETQIFELKGPVRGSFDPEKATH